MGIIIIMYLTFWSYENEMEKKNTKILDWMTIKRKSIYKFNMVSVQIPAVLFVFDMGRKSR